MSFHFRIQINDITGPPVWRRLLVPEQFSFWRFHLLLQTAFGWHNSHLFQFSPGGYNTQPLIGVPYPEAEEKILDCKKVKLPTIFNIPGQQFIYLYDFGDSWEHLITLEKITIDKMLKAAYIDGEGACPPEDCGGPWGYEDFKVIMNDPKNPEHASMKEWMGLSKKQKFDAHSFNPDRIRLIVPKV